MNVDGIRRWGLLLAVVAAPVAFVLITDNIWEDFFITYRCSLNLVHGHGLVFEIGRRVHAFTSPLGVLVPAGLAALARTDDPLTVIMLFRAVAIAALGGAWWLAAPRLGSGLAAAAAALLWALDVKIAAFSTNGMETALLLLAVVLAWRALLDHRPVLAGVALGALLWTRPDGFVFFGALAAAAWIFRGETAWRWRDVAVIAGVSAVLYLPWFFWAWVYYGSPVPNTVSAKGSHIGSLETLWQLARYPWRFLFGHSAAHDAFLPAYSFFGPWPAWLPWFGRVLAWAGAGAAAWRRCPRPARVAGLAFVLGGFYLTITTRAPWYFPAWSLLAYFAAGGLLATAWSALAAQRAARMTLAAVAGLVVLGQAWLFAGATVQLRAQQRLIEWGLRAPLGRLLHEAARSSRDTVFLEPLGYIGFYSDLAMRDTPGLCAPEVVALCRQGRRSMPELIAALRTDWVVLRGDDLAAFSPEARAALDRDYRFVRLFDQRAAVADVPWLPGRDLLMFDAHYGVWQRRAAEGATP